jgi:hypothetical protein
MQQMKACILAALALLLSSPKLMRSGSSGNSLQPEFHTSDRCEGCHNQVIAPSGQDVSIGTDWRASIMANSARDPYWQAGVRRETVDHPEAKAEIQDECSACHMPISRYEAKLRNHLGEVFANLPFEAHREHSAEAEDGVTCSICHQITTEKLGMRESFNGGFVVAAPAVKNERPEYGPFVIESAQQRIMQTSTGGFVPTSAEHIRDPKLCATCHQLYTTALGPEGQVVGHLPEQVPYLEWLHSDYSGQLSCQECHMPEVQEPAPVTAVLGPLRSGARHHRFIGGNFFMQRVLNRYRDDLDTGALPEELSAATARTAAFLNSQAATVTIRSVETAAGKLQADVFVQNQTGHKLPTAYPSRRAWLHFLVRDSYGRTVFESGALNPDGSIKGNDNDADPARYEPHYREITSSEQVQIYEPILKDSAGRVTTGLLAAIDYFKDNRLLPAGFDKSTAEKDILVAGDAAQDPNFKGGGHGVRYSVPIAGAEGPFRVIVELWYQPIGFRWAHNLERYRQTEEALRFVGYYESMASTTAAILASAEAVTRKNMD